MPNEILNKRTIGAKIFDNGDGTYTARCGAAPLHYSDDGVSWDDIETTAVDKGAFWAFEKANHKVYVAKDFGANQLIRFDSKKRNDGINRSLFFEPKQLIWVKKDDLSDRQIFRSALPVIGIINGNTITYENAFGLGIDYELVFSASGLSKNLVIKQKSALEQPPTPQHKLCLASRFQADNIKMVRKDGTEWDKIIDFDSDERTFFETADGKRFPMLKAMIWDADDIKNDIRVLWKFWNGNLWQLKILPTQFLQNATYPVRTDATFGPQDWGSNSRQVVNDNVSGTYNAACTAASGNNVYDITGAGQQNVVHDSSITNWYIRRADYQFDTSSIPGGSVVTAASVTMYSAASGGGDANSFNLVAVDLTNAAGISNPLVVADFDAFPTDPATDIDGSKTFASYLNQDANVTMSLTGFSMINPGGTTRVGFRSQNEMTEQDDGSASDPTGTNVIRVNVASDVPYLDVTYTEGADNAPFMDINF